MSLELTNRGLLREQAYINGQWIMAKSGKTFAVTNPANGDQLATVPDMDDTDTRAAIEAAEAAWPAWRSTPAKERAVFCANGSICSWPTKRILLA